MMKKILFISTLLISCLSNAQFTGKPIYTIRVERADTLLGNIEVEMFPTIAPLHVANWDSIVTAGGYDSTAFHRVISGFVIQGGDPNSVSGPTSTWGQGNSNQANVNAEFSEVPHARGILSAARSSNVNSASSQFFICHGDAFSLDNNYSVYGETISGMDIVDLIVNAPKNTSDLPDEKISMSITRTGSNDSLPDAPTLILPVEGVTSLTNAEKFTWTAVTNTKLYRLEIATDSSFNNIVYTHETKQTYAYANKLVDGFTKHYWRVRANNGGNFSTSTEFRSFTTAVGTPELIYPEHENFTTSDRPLFDWEEGNQVSKYKIEVSISSVFSNPTVTVEIDEEVTMSHYQALVTLGINKNYYWRVAAIDVNGNQGEYSETHHFKADHPKSIVELDNKNYISMVPNPFANNLSVNSKVKDQLTVFNILGEIVLTKAINIGQTNINTSSLESGVYIYKTINSKGKIIKR